MSQVSIKGFVNYPSLYSATPGQVAAVGQLSKNGYSFSPTLQVYDNLGSYSNVSLVAFYAALDGTDFSVPQLYGDYALDVCNWIYQQANLGNFTGNNASFVQALTAQFGNTISAVTAGNMINFNTNFYCPEWIQYSQSTADGNTSVVRLWLCDASFQTQYDLFTIRVIPPVQNVDDFFAGYQSVLNELSDFDIPTLMQRIQAAANEEPFTVQRSYNFNYVNPNNTQQTIQTVWTVIEYGMAGDNLDTIKAAIVSYIAANSQYTPQQWTVLFPELFLSTEFIVTPRWDQYAIPSNTLNPGGIYSPSVAYGDALNVAQTTAQGTGYTASGVAESLNIAPWQYRSLMLEFVAGPLNQGNDSSIQLEFPDYINVPSTSADFARMSTLTQGWVNFISAMLVIAETMTEYTPLPAQVIGGPTYQRVVRNNLYYLAASYNSINYLMVPLAQLQALVGAGIVGQPREPVNSQ
jgi:hypothetical protein